MSASDRRAKLDREHADLSMRRQCAMLGVARSGVYRKPRPANDNDLEARRRIDALFTARPFFGARRIARTLSEEGFPIDRKRVRRLMRLMGIEALGPKPRTAKPAPEHKIYPYLLRDLAIERPTRSGRPTSPISRSAAAFSTWSPSSTGRAGRFSPGGCRTPWTPRSAWRRWRRRWPAMANRTSSTPTKAASSPARLSPAC